MKKFLLPALFLVLSFTFSKTFAQTSTTKALQFYFGIGGAYNSYKNLNDAFSSSNLPTVGKFTFTNLGEADVRLQNLLLGITGSMGFSGKRSDHYNTSLTNFYGGINAGYYVLNSKKFHLAPQVGIGIYSSQASITQRNGFSDFNEVLANNNSVDINQNTAALDFCLKFDFADFTQRKTRMASIRLGYKYGLSNRGWGIDETSNSTVNNSPKDRISQPYIMLAVGLARLK